MSNALAAGVRLAHSTQNPGLLAMGEVLQGWYDNPITRGAAILASLTAIWLETQATDAEVQKAQDDVNQFKGEFSSARFSTVDPNVSLLVSKCWAVVWGVKDFAMPLATFVKLSITNGEDAIKEAFIHGCTLLSNREKGFRIPWELFGDLPEAFQVSQEIKKMVDDYMDQSKIFDEPLPPVAPFLPNAPIHNFHLKRPSFEKK